MNFRKLLGITLLLSSLAVKGYSQTVTGSYAFVRGADTIEGFIIRGCVVTDSYQFLSEEDKQKYAKLIRNVKKVYPYAVLAGETLDKYNEMLSKMTSESERKQAMKEAEADIEKRFTKDIKAMSFSQGMVLLKLIDRETGDASYYLVEELRGKFRAFFYQAFAKVFGYNLKMRYDPYSNTEDRMIERIVLSINHGQI